MAGARQLLCGRKARWTGPTTATFLPVFSAAISGFTQPFSQALSMMAHSIVLMVTGVSSRLKVHDVSQGAGRSDP